MTDISLAQLHPVAAVPDLAHARRLALKAESTAAAGKKEFAAQQREWKVELSERNKAMRQIDKDRRDEKIKAEMERQEGGGSP